MQRAYPVLAIALVLATLLVGRTAGGPEAGPRPASPTTAGDRALDATPTPQVLIGQPPGWEPLPEGCSPERVVGIVLALVDAFNRGDRARLAALFRPDILAADGTPGTLNRPQPGLFGVEFRPEVDPATDEAGLRGVYARNGADLAEWAAKRHARGERWTVLQLFMGGYWWRGGVNIAFNVRREADDLPTHLVGGKGAVDCNHGTVFLWSMGGPPTRLDGPLEPGATPAGVGLAPRSRTS